MIKDKYLVLPINPLNGHLVNQVRLFESKKIAIEWFDKQVKHSNKGRFKYEFKVFKIEQAEEITNE